MKTKEVIPSCEWTHSLLDRLQDIEENIDAYNNGYYDTHDLEDIEEHLEEYKTELDYYKRLLPDPKIGFDSYKIVEGQLKKKY